MRRRARARRRMRGRRGRWRAAGPNLLRSRATWALARPAPAPSVGAATPLTSPAACRGRRAGNELWLQDLLAAASAGLDPPIQTARVRPAPAPSAPEPGWGLLGPASASGERGARGAGRAARLSVGERRGLGLRLLRKRQPRGGAGRPSRPPPRLRTTERVPCVRAGATGQGASARGPRLRTGLCASRRGSQLLRFLTASRRVSIYSGHIPGLTQGCVLQMDAWVRVARDTASILSHSGLLLLGVNRGCSQ